MSLPAPPEDLWTAPPKGLALCADEVHVWRAALDRTPAERQGLSKFLTSDELERAGRFHFAKDRDHFVNARATLRLMLGHYLKAPPGELRFRYSEFGKPSLAEGHGRGLRFNLSHSHGLALYAFAGGREVGVDVEFMRPEMAGEEIAERFFSTAEVRALKSLPQAARTEEFFCCWTRKEAYIKARGEGLSLPPHLFTVSLSPREPAAPLEVVDELQELGRWSVRGLKPREGYAAAVVVEGRGWRLRCLQWPRGGAGVGEIR